MRGAIGIPGEIIIWGTGQVSKALQITVEAGSFVPALWITLDSRGEFGIPQDFFGKHEKTSEGNACGLGVRLLTLPSNTIFLQE